MYRTSATLSLIFINLLVYFTIIRGENDIVEGKFLTKKHILTGYNRNEIPEFSNGELNYIYVDFYLKTVNKFDEVMGYIRTTGLLDIVWFDPRLKWNNSEHNFKSLIFSSSEVWIPNVIIGNPVDQVLLMNSDKLESVVVFPNGMARTVTGGVLGTSCIPNVRYYPFDIHNCYITFSLYEIFHINELLGIQLLKRPSSLTNFSILEDNPKWNIQIEKPYSGGYMGSNLSYVSFPVVLQRKPNFILLNIVSPIIILGFLNVAVFLIPVDAGERLSYSLTVLLSFAVYMTILNAMIPDNSDPLPRYTFMLLFKFCYSALIALVNVYVLNVHKRTENHKISRTMLGIVKFSNRFMCRRHESETSIDDQSDLHRKKSNTNGFIQQEINENNKDENDTRCNAMENLTWEQVSQALDRLFLAIFLTLLVAEIIVWLSVSVLKASHRNDLVSHIN